MNLWLKSTGLLLGLMAAATLGCAKPAADVADARDHAEHAHDHADHSHSGAGHSHDGWWCDEHGVPEGVCALCNSKVAAEFQKKGDWCDEHDRPDSQCFVCHPEHQARFAAQYEAKYGKKPPTPEG